MSSQLKAILLVTVIMILGFVAASLFDIVVAVLYSRFYSTGAFIAVFGVAGIFAALTAFGAAMSYTPKDKKARWITVAFIVLIGIVFVYPLSVIEGGEYQAAFISYGVAGAAIAIFQGWLKVDE